MAMEIRDNWSLSVLSLPREKVPAKPSEAKLPSQGVHEPVVQVKRVGREADSYSEPGSVIDIYV